MVDLAISFDAESGKYLYEQIYEHIKGEIREGRLIHNEKLPSSRSLASYLQVSRSTVDQAYGQLISEGYIETRPCKGCFVSRLEGIYDLKGVGALPMQSKDMGDERLEYDFSPNAVDIDSFPLATWRKLAKDILIDKNRDLYSLGDPKGDQGLRTSICRYLHNSRGVNCSPEQIIIGAGNDYLLLLLERIIGEGKKIALENPTYMRAYRLFKSSSWECEAIPVDSRGMSVDRLEESGADLAYVMPSHQFPTGVVMPIGRRIELLRWAMGKEGRYILEDDYDSEFRYRGKPIPSLQGSDMAGHVIYMGTFSKALAPAIRISYMALPKSLLDSYRENCGFMSSTVSRVDQAILETFICGGYFERHLNKMRRLYRMRRDCLLEALGEHLGDVRISGEDAGLHLVLHCDGGKKEEEIVSAAAKKGVKVYGMSKYFVGENDDVRQSAAARVGNSDGQSFNADRHPTLIIGYAGLSEEKIRAGIGLLSDCI